MNKILYLAASFLFFGFCTSNIADAASVTNATKPGSAITITATNVPGAQSFVFTPSTNVVLTGGVVDNSFAVSAYHDQANKKKAGQQYGMASDKNNVFFQDINNTTGAATVTATGSSIFVSPWHTM